MWLNIKPPEFPPGTPPNQIFAAIMEFRMAGRTITLAAGIDGAVSMFVEMGPAIIGAGEHDEVWPTTEKFLGAFQAFVTKMQPSTSHSFPADGTVRFIARTLSGNYAHVSPETELKAQKDPFTPLFFIGHELLGKVREMEGKHPPQRR